MLLYSGTTWTQAIIFQLLNCDKNLNIHHISDVSPFYEIDATWETESDDIVERYRINHENLGYNVFNTHLTWELMPKGESFKYIYLLRDPRDVVVSFYHHLSNQEGASGFNGSFHDFLIEWCEGKIVFGSWKHHLKSWLNCQSSNVLFLKYEDLKLNTKKSITNIAKFLDLSLTDAQIDALIPAISFESMKENKLKYQPISVAWKNGFEFLRKGVIGDGQLMFTDEDDLLLQSYLNDFDYIDIFNSIVS